MRRTELIMGMPITVVIPERERMDTPVPGTRFITLSQAIEAVFNRFRAVDERFSPYKPDSETCRIDRGEL
ncbi:MAG TPA: FAD:protein FMN transferase, partial [Spirochaetia bacterium]|nr:FAD:protein FMN transferase [Spirochaetia bacterium]